MKTEQILEILKVIAWIIFIGLCIRTGALFISFIVSLFIQSDGTQFLYMEWNFSELFSTSKIHYIILASFIIFLSGLKAWLFYHVVKIISRININHPFSEYIAGIISKLSGISLQIGIVAFITNVYAKYLMNNKISFNYDGGETEFLFLAGILYVIAVIFKRGIELQSENELTV